ncbi:phage head spike fiber domain-containing protein [Massilia rhizosphaerae]|uniref:phage head spike fiber domain-containing protein n=1 Tax=Massilia rhizosphaerae TaxID=2784389 RepID=UPI0018DE8D36|nr:hypothetical protein [Massilia rhizosphaerae]
MMIIDPVALGDVACTRASVKYVYDRTGTLVQVPVNTLAVTYDPSDLTKAPYALVEDSATNLCSWSTAIDSNWANNGATWTANFGTAPDGTLSTTLVSSGTKYRSIGGLTIGADYTFSEFVRAGSSHTIWIYADGMPLSTHVVLDLSTQTFSGVTGSVTSMGCEYVGNGMYRVWMSFQPSGSTCAIHAYPSGGSVEFWGVQLEVGLTPSSYIPTSGSVVTRAADTVASGAGLVYSNVSITETAYSSASTYAKDAIVYDPATYLMYQSLIDGNVGHALSDTASWTPLLTMVNRWSMFDQYNNTQTSNAEEIIVVLQPKALAQGVYIGNVDASDIRISTYDPTDGLVYQEVQDLIISDSGSSFYNWSFKRIRKRSYAVSVQLPPYYTGLVTIAFRKPSGTAKCGMCVLGPLVDVGLAQYGLSREIKDYSTVNFNFDGTSNVVKRNFAKIMDVDVILDNVYIDSVIESLENYRQKPVAWIGAAAYGSACLYGTYTSFKNVIQYPTVSAMNLQIQGTV